MWKRILVPHDFSELGTKAVRLATDLAKAYDAELVLFHVTTSAELAESAVSHATSGAAADEHPAASSARRRLQKIADGVQGLRVRVAVAVGDPGDKILAAVDDYDTDAIVMGTHGRTGISHLIFGSVAEYVVRRAAIPVVVFRDVVEAASTVEIRTLQGDLVG